MDLSNENVIHVKKGNIEFLQFRKLLEFSECLNHAYSLGTNLNFRTVNLDKKQGNEKEAPINCYKDLCNAIKTNYINVVKPQQSHTNNVQIVDKKINTNMPDFNLKEYSNTDGLITNKQNIILSTTNADCILMLFFDPIKKVIANIHSGWRGTLQKISIKTVEKMKEKYSCNPKDIICCICPSIRKCHFEVDQDVKELFNREFSNIDGIIEETIPNLKWHIDTIEINKEILKQEGLKEENIIDSKICSMCNSKLIHSYRTEGKTFGLNTAIIGLN